MSTLEKLNALLEHSREEPGFLDAQGVAVQEKLSCPYCEKAYLPCTLEKLNCLLEKSLTAYLKKTYLPSTLEKLKKNALLKHSREEPRLLDAQGVAVQEKLSCPM